MDKSAPLRQSTETRQCSVLVVDDDPQNILLVGSLLNEAGYRIHVADSGELALAIAKEVSIDLVLLDISCYLRKRMVSRPAANSRRARTRARFP